MQYMYGVMKLVNVRSVNGFSPVLYQAITWTNANPL